MDLTARGLWPGLPLAGLSPLRTLPRAPPVRPDAQPRAENRPIPQAPASAPDPAAAPWWLPVETPGPDTPAGPPPAFDISILERERAILSLLNRAAIEPENHSPSAPCDAPGDTPAALSVAPARPGGIVRHPTSQGYVAACAKSG